MFIHMFIQSTGSIYGQIFLKFDRNVQLLFKSWMSSLGKNRASNLLLWRILTYKFGFLTKLTQHFLTSQAKNYKTFGPQVVFIKLRKTHCFDTQNG